jgi:hypothetical protein
MLVHIPKDVDEDGIADFYEYKYFSNLSKLNKDDDEDPEPQGRKGVFLNADDIINGDNLSNWQEYRGFFISDLKSIPGGYSHSGYMHIRTDPTRKDYFVYNTFEENELIKIGLGNMASLDNDSYLNIHLIFHSEFTRSLKSPHFLYRSDIAMVPLFGWGQFCRKSKITDNKQNIINFNSILEPETFISATLDFNEVNYYKTTESFQPIVTVKLADEAEELLLLDANGNPNKVAVGVAIPFTGCNDNEPDLLFFPSILDANIMLDKDDCGGNPCSSCYDLMSYWYDKIISFPRTTYKVILLSEGLHEPDGKPAFTITRPMFRSTLAHELGHSISMPHNTDTTSIMHDTLYLTGNTFKPEDKAWMNVNIEPHHDLYDWNNDY